MRRTYRNRIHKILLLITIVFVMLTLCGCRTRITNNDEVTNVMYDDGGYLQEEYDMRRDELSLSKAEKPIFTGWGQAEEDDYDEYDYSDMEYLEDYDASDYEEYVEEPEERPATTTTTQPSSSRSRTIPRRTPTTQPTKKPDDKKEDDKKEDDKKEEDKPEAEDKVTVTVTFNANGGKCSATTRKVNKGETYGKLPKATREGYDFSGWYTKKDGGKRVKSTTTMNATKNHTLYAHWDVKIDEYEETKTKYTVTFDLNCEDAYIEAGENTIEVEEGGTYGTFPQVKREGFTFEGWYTEPEGGSKVESGKAFKANDNQTLYAHWKNDPDYYQKYWEEQFDAAKEVITDEYTYCLFNTKDTDSKKAFLNSCKLTEGNDEDGYNYVVYFGSQEEAEEIWEKEEFASSTIILIPPKAVSSTGKKHLLYKMMTMDAAYLSFGDNINKAAEEMEVGEYDLIEVLTPPVGDEGA